MKPQTVEKGERRKNNNTGVNLIKVHYRHICKDCNKLLYTIIYANKRGILKKTLREPKLE
jgi:RNase P subunit RPR2